MEFVSYKQAAKLLGISNEALRVRISRGQLTRHEIDGKPRISTEEIRNYLKFDAEPEEVVRLKKSLQRKDEQLASIKKQLEAGIKTSNVVDEVSSLIDPLLDEYPKVLEKTKKYKKPVLPKRKTKVEAALYLTDWHVGEQISYEDTQDHNEYNLEVAAKRAEHVALITDEWLDNYESIHGVSRINYFILGDMVNNAGQLHPSQNNDYAWVLAQALDASLLMYQLIQYGIRRGIDVRVITTRGGNHGRSTGKMPSGPAAVQTSWDQAAYEHLGAMLRQEEVQWHMSRAYSATVEVAGHNIWVAHGDAVKGGGGALGIPAYGVKRQGDSAISVSMLNAIAAKDTDKIIRYIRTGHFHEEVKITVPLGNSKICPSIKGTGPWELDSLGKTSRPEALLEFFHPRNGLIGEHVINAKNPRGNGFITGALETLSPAATMV